MRFTEKKFHSFLQNYKNYYCETKPVMQYHFHPDQNLDTIKIGIWIVFLPTTCVYTSCRQKLSLGPCCLQEAAGLSSIRPELDKLNVPLYGILNGRRGADEFRKYLKGELFYDKEVSHCLLIGEY